MKIYCPHFQEMLEPHECYFCFFKKTSISQEPIKPKFVPDDGLENTKWTEQGLK